MDDKTYLDMERGKKPAPEQPRRSAPKQTALEKLAARLIDEDGQEKTAGMQRMARLLRAVGKKGGDAAPEGLKSSLLRSSEKTFRRIARKPRLVANPKFVESTKALNAAEMAAPNMPKLMAQSRTPAAHKARAAINAHKAQGHLERIRGLTKRAQDQWRTKILELREMRRGSQKPSIWGE